jgi:hypothetical protein
MFTSFPNNCKNILTWSFITCQIKSSVVTSYTQDESKYVLKFPIPLNQSVMVAKHTAVFGLCAMGLLQNLWGNNCNACVTCSAYISQALQGEKQKSDLNNLKSSIKTTSSLCLQQTQQ